MNWLQRFMLGRYGPDQLSLAMLILAFIVGLVPMLWAKIVTLALAVIVFYRMFSKNIAKRRRENDWFLKVWSPVKTFFVRLFKGRPDKATHKHFKCPKCAQELRVPKGKGKVTITCPKCGEKFTRKT